MTRDKIIRMAKEVGIRLMGDGFGKPDRTDVWATQDEFECFANLVAAAEREACAKLLEVTDLSGLKTDPWLASYTATMLSAYVKAIRARGQ
jgi:hypothetical protein